MSEGINLETESSMSTTNHAIFTKFGIYVENGVLHNGVLQCAEWYKYAFLHNPRWRTAAILKYLNRHNTAADCPIWLKFCMTYTKVPAGLTTSMSELEVQFRRQGVFFFKFRFGDMAATNKDIFSKFGVYVENGVPEHVEWSKYALLHNPR